MATKVNIIGFDMVLSQGVSFPEFFQRLESKRGLVEKHGRRGVVSYVDELDGYAVGILISYKGDKKFFITEEGKDKLIVAKQELKKDQHSSEANVFIVNPVTCKGIVIQYFGSMSMGSMEGYFKKINNQIRSEKVKEKVKELKEGAGMHSHKAAEKARSEFNGEFQIIPMMTERDIDYVIDNYSEISSLDMSVQGSVPDASIFTPASPLIRTSSCHIGFEKGRFTTNAIKQGVKDIVNKVINSDRSKVLRITGEAFGGEKLSLYIGDNLDYFGSMSYDRYVELLPDDYWENYVGCKALAIIKKIMIDKSLSVFGQGPGDASWKMVSARDYWS